MIIRIVSSKDTTLVNCYNNDFRSQSLDANLGASPYLQVFKRLDETSSSLYGDDLARSLIYFDLSPYHIAMNQFSLSSSSISCSLKLYNMPHQETVPQSYDIVIHPLSRSWDEGTGIDSDRYKDEGVASWLSASSLVSWSQTGSDYIDSIYSVVHFDQGTENIDVYITSVWNYWLASGNCGLILKLSGTEETNDISYYKKLFYSRHAYETKYYPTIDVKVLDTIQDRRGNLVLGKSGSIYLHNIIDGVYENLSTGTSTLNVVLYDTVVLASMSYSSSFTSSYVSTGIYKADIYIPTTYTGSFLYDVWSTGSTQFLTGTIHISSSIPNQSAKAQQLLILFDDLKEEYKQEDNARVNFFIRNARWNLNTYYENISDLPIITLDNVYYQIEDYVEQFILITASEYTKCSYDSTGMYFRLPMSSLLADSYYKIILKVRRNNLLETYSGEDWKFKVVQ